LLAAGGLKPGSAASVFPPGEIQPLFDEIIRNGRQGKAETPEICRRLLEALLLQIRDSRAPAAGRDELAFETYQHCREHLQRHFMRLRSIAEAAGECHVSDAYFCRLFQRFDHESPYRHLLRLKMAWAAERLQQPGALVKQIAEEAGYANQFHFSRVFKSVFGLSPTEMVRMR
jgi:AraC-like DNA-binding protein